MRTITFLLGVGLLLTMACVPIGCQYAVAAGPAWIGERVFESNGFCFGCVLLVLVFGAGGVGAILQSIFGDA